MFTSNSNVDEIIEIASNHLFHAVQMQSQVSKADQSAVAHLVKK